MFLSTIQSNTQRVAALLVLIATMTSLSACDNLDMQKKMIQDSLRLEQKQLQQRTEPALIQKILSPH